MFECLSICVSLFIFVLQYKPGNETGGEVPKEPGFPTEVPVVVGDLGVDDIDVVEVVEEGTETGAEFSVCCLTGSL